MRCSSCNVENAKEASRCVSCGVALTKKSKRRGGGQVEMPSPFSWPVDPLSWPCTRAYWAAMAGLIPGVGLVLGPVAVVLGFIGWRHVKAEPACTVSGQATAAVVFGTLETLTNWVGLWLMVLGWPGSGS